MRALALLLLPAAASGRSPYPLRPFGHHVLPSYFDAPSSRVQSRAEDGDTNILRVISFTRRVADASLISVIVKKGQLVVKVPRGALEPAPQQARAGQD